MILDLIRQNSDALMQLAACCGGLAVLLILIVRESRK